MNEILQNFETSRLGMFMAGVELGAALKTKEVAESQTGLFKAILGLQ
mgnify:CR=1 FL=1